MAKIRRKLLTVRGSGIFPIDMLRYDHAWPRTEQDSWKILASYDNPQNEPRMREVQLLTDADNINPDRWRSFTWEMTWEFVV